MLECFFSHRIDEEIVFNHLYGNRNAIWSLLLASGYLKVENRHFDPETGIWTYTLKLTNKEVAIMFRNIIKGGGYGIMGLPLRERKC